ncbi:hypothetical protein GO730_21035 [Spirosoma sp. HMF3257]|uniref:Uncharacterized protein n=1 Tax=Spirosoma telluris TaxID=2183553 RepID=A0A327NQI0_9BACT|nr:hypothetical protein [Spirosoma telluris]RAI76034.1 hypothetical protein HMF3257_20960 [Spirosoma telluris]
MEVTFDNPELRLICEDDDVTNETYGESTAQSIHDWVADFQAAVSLNDIIIGQLTQLGDATFRVNLTDDFVLYFSVVNKKTTQNAKGEINKESVNRIKLLRIESHIITQ